MKSSKIRLAMAGALVAMFAVGTPANAYGQATPPAKIVILEFQRIMLESAAAIDIKVQIDQRRLVYQNDITKQEKMLREAERELARQATILAPDALAQKRREFEGRIAEVQTGMQARMLREAERELARQATILAPDALAQKRREFEGRIAEVQTGMQARKRELDQAFAYGMKEVQRTLTMIIAALAKERDFNLVLPHGQIVFSDSSLNITDETLRRLNAQLPTVKVPLVQN